MKQTLIAVAVGLVVALGSSGFGETILAQNADPIPSIRKQYAAINRRAARYKKVKKELSGFSLEGGELLAYFDRGAIAKIVAHHFGEGGNTVEEYYYSNGQLIFVFERISYYDGLLSGKTVRTSDNRYYFQDNNLIRWVNEKGNAVPANEDYRLREKELLEHSNKFLTAASSSSRIVEAGN